MKTGLVMEGGAMRGMFTAGVIDVFMENHIETDGAIGVSAGAAFGCNFVSKQHGRVLRYNLRFCKDPRFCSWWSFLTTGNLYNVEFGYYTIPTIYDKFDYDAFAKSRMDFYSVSTDVTTAQAVYHKYRTFTGEDTKWLIASASMPLVSKPVYAGGRAMLDGGMSDSVPLKYMEDQGYEKNIVILTQPKVYKKKDLSYMPLVRLGLHNYPNLVRAIDERPNKYNNAIRYVNRRAKEGAAFIIQPPARLGIGPICHNRDELKRVYYLGREAAERRLPALQKWLKED